MSFFCSLSKLIQGVSRVRTRELLDCSRMLYHRAISPLHTDSITSLQTLSGCLSTVTRFFVPSQVFSRYRCHFFLVFQKLNTGTPGFIPGTSRTEDKCSTELYPLLYLRIQQNHCEHVHLALTLKQQHRCSTISPLHTGSITSLQTRSGCLSTVTMFFVPSQMFSRDRCRFSPVFQKFYKRTHGAEPGTSRTAAECPITELYPLYLRIQKHHFKHVQLALTLEQYWLCEGKYSFVNLLLIFYYCVQSSRTAVVCFTTELCPLCKQIH